MVLTGDGIRERTISADVLVPVLQNLLGGLGAGVVIWILFAAALSALALPPTGEAIKLIAAAVGGLVAAFATSFRFFGDELGIANQMYRRGQQSQLARLNTLQAELRAAHEVIVQMRRNGTAAPRQVVTKRSLTRRDAVQLLRWHYSGVDVTRKHCEAALGMGQPAWNKASSVLVASRVKEGNAFPFPTLDEAEQTLDQYLSAVDGLNPHVLPFKE